MITIKTIPNRNKAKGQPKLYCDNSIEEIMQCTDEAVRLLALRVKSSCLLYDFQRINDDLNESLKE